MHGAAATSKSPQNGRKTQARGKLQNQPPETGMWIKYGLDELRGDPQKTERWLALREEPPPHHSTTKNRRGLGGARKPIQQALGTLYPMKTTKEENNRTPIWATKAKQWSTKEKWGRTQHHLEERNQLQSSQPSGPNNPKAATEDHAKK